MFTVLRLLLKIVIGFVVVSLLWVGVYAFVPVPFTMTMAGDLIGGHSVTKDWTPLSSIDPNMARAAIAGEDAKFCRHHGFDWGAIAGAAVHNADGGRIRGGDRAPVKPVVAAEFGVLASDRGPRHVRIDGRQR
ncbi:transglycosylase domain-containing protein, partial [uncultured Brevundimonas sp.]|uniref:transglycosylase domain-containing protein n=1 Tax=uncultured Brevundimonas sp. TaxID=213418 RepID=UPI00345D5453